MLIASALFVGAGEAHAGKYADWELWLSSANAVLPAQRGKVGPFRSNIALGGGLAPEYLGSDDLEFKPLALLDVTYAGALFVSTQQGIGWNLWRRRTLRAGPRVTFDFGRDSADNPTLAGLPDIGVAAELGFFFESFVGSWRFKGDIRQDIAGGHDGLLINGEVARGSRWSDNASIIVGGRVSYMDDSYAESYFQVTANNATASRPTYLASGGFRDLNGYVQLIYEVTRSFYVSSELRATYLAEDAADSPLSDSDTFLTGAVLAGYRF
ncbi:MAG: MipA/OmpV family protein [Alphaproteobacteria bacterium]|nr:MipA/OmpV family protein [Alphaproteobacteria bacterium]MDP6563809.1 MipA/OmpV family protein [Alphaproteobacteria bacterium]MDP6811754.1 MipA/OmpV family protein [Alphaproteobacteria bacterium]